MTIEQLTDRERHALKEGYYTAPDLGFRAVALIDALTVQTQRDCQLAADWKARAAELEVELGVRTTQYETAVRDVAHERQMRGIMAHTIAKCESELTQLRAELAAAKARAEAAERELHSVDEAQANEADALVRAEKAECAALRAALGRQRQELANLEDRRAVAIAQRDQERAEVERLRGSLRSQDACEAEIDALSKQLATEKTLFAAMVLEFGGLKDAAESRLAAATENASVAVREMSRLQTRLVDEQVECEKLRLDLERMNASAERWERRNGELDARLAAANALLVDALPTNVCKAPWLIRRDEHFAACGFTPLRAAQPAAPARTEAEQRGHHCGLSGWRPDLGDEPCPACERGKAAYLARREAAK